MPQTVRVVGSIEIDRPLEEVFDFVADQRNEPLYNPEITTSRKVTEGPIGVGTMFQTVSLSGGTPIEAVIEVTGFDRPHLMASTTHLSSMDLDGGLTFDEIPNGTRMSWSYDVHPNGPLLWMKPLVGMIGRSNERRLWRGLKLHLEGYGDDREPAS